jgi:hypothetical protein
MDLDMDSASDPTTVPAVTYKAVGKLWGRYEPSLRNARAGTFITEGMEVPVILSNAAVKKAFKACTIKTWAECRKVITGDRTWIIYPRMSKDGVVGTLMRYDMKRSEREGFYIVGKVIQVQPDSVVLAIYYNVRSPNYKRIVPEEAVSIAAPELLPEQGFTLQLWGSSIPPTALLHILTTSAGDSY